MRHLVALVAAVVCLHARVVQAQDAYAAVLLEYLSGDADHALTRLAALDRIEVLAGTSAFNTTRSQGVLTGAAAMHTEQAVRRGGGLTRNYDLQVATAIVEFGEPRTAKSNTPLSIHPYYPRPVSDDFRILWYCVVINRFESDGAWAAAEKYLDHALALYPKNVEIRLLAGIADEMHASPRTSDTNGGDRRKALTEAEKQYRVVLEAQPDRLEAKLRLGRVLVQLNRRDEARLLLTPLRTAPDSRLAYLASLFLGGIEDTAGHPEAAATLYAEAANLMPAAQTARLAASEMQYREGAREAAAAAVPMAAGEGNTFDPWWTYAFGEYWRGDLLLTALRQKRRS